MMPGPGRSAEISTHGGRGMQAAVESLLARSGVTLVEGEDLVCSPGAAARGGGIGREARRGLREARTVQAMLFYATALHGALEREVAVLGEDLRCVRGSGSSTPLLRERLQTLIARSAYGVAFGRPPTVLIGGPPNAGKSTLANRLCGYERCIVTGEAGTTRDLVGEDVSLRGFPFRLVDSAGLRAKGDPLELAGMERARDAAAQAALLLLVVDGSRPEPLAGVPDQWLQSRRTLIVLNKLDLGQAHPPQVVAARTARPCVGVSATEGEGFEALTGHVIFRSPFRGPATRDLPCPFTPRQVKRLQEALEHLSEDGLRAAEALEDLLGETT
jgi:tRNA modification GTPase